MPDSVIIGIIRRPHGIRGEVKVKPLTDFPQRFHEVESVSLDFPNGKNECFRISQVRAQNKDMLLKFEGVDSRDRAEDLLGCTIMIPIEQIRSLPEDRFYHFEVLGYEVRTISGQRIGLVKDVMDLPANAVFVVTDGVREYLIPSVKHIVKKIDKDANQIVIDPIDGLLE